MPSQWKEAVALPRVLTLSTATSRAYHKADVKGSRPELSRSVHQSILHRLCTDVSPDFGVHDQLVHTTNGVPGLSTLHQASPRKVAKGKDRRKQPKPIPSGWKRSHYALHYNRLFLINL